MSIFEKGLFFKQKEKIPEFCKHNKIAGNCEKCQMSEEEAQYEANLLRAMTHQGGEHKEDYASGGEKYPSRESEIDSISAEKFSSTADDYRHAEKNLSYERNQENGKFLQAEEELKKDSEKDIDNTPGHRAAVYVKRGNFIAKAQSNLQKRRESYNKLKEEFDPTKGKKT